MQKLLTLFLSLLFVAVALPALAQPAAREKKYFKILEKTFDEQRAYNTVWFVEQRWRLAGNSGFNESIYHVEKILQQAGYKKEDNGEVTGTLTYRIEKRPMKHVTWEPVDASLYIVGEKEPLLQFRTNRNMVAMYSASTPSGGVTAGLVYVGKGSPKEFEEKDVKGKIIMGEGGIGGLYGNAMKYGALGALAFSMPGYTQPAKHTNSIQFQGIGYTDSVRQKWGLLLSYAAKEKLKAALAKGPVSVSVVVNTKIYASEELTLVANVRGKTHPNERFVFSAHVQEPGANDNASGVGTLAEMARTTAALVQKRKISPRRTITFLWGDEIVSTRRYIQDDSIRAKGIKWGLSLDMEEAASFAVERSVNGTKWEALNGIPQKTAISPLLTFTDDRPLPGKSFYRLKRMVASGEVRYSTVLPFEAIDITSIKCYPNPFTSFIKVTGVLPGEQVAITDIYGKRLYLSSPAITNTIKIDVSDLQPGMYVISTGKKKMKIQKK